MVRQVLRNPLGVKGKRKGEMTYKETALGILPSSKLIPLGLDEPVKKLA